MLEILIDTTAVSNQPTGIGHYVLNLITELHTLQSQDPSFQLSCLFQPRLKNWVRRNTELPAPLKSQEALQFLPLPVRLSNLLVQYTPSLLRRYLGQSFKPPQVLHGTDFSVLPWPQAKKIMSVHDLTFIRYPEYADAVVQNYRRRLERCLEWTDLVVTLSESSKQDIVELLGVDPERIVAIPLGSRYDQQQLLKSQGKESQWQALEQQVDYDFSAPYLLTVGSLEPRKNLPTLIQVFNQLKSGQHFEHQLVIIGGVSAKSQATLDAIANSPWQHQIHHLGYVSEPVLQLFYKRADIFVYPSLYEGFGLPLLEAMTFETPIISSNRSSMPEVVGEAALLFDPAEPEQLATHLLKLVGDRALHAELKQRGLQQVQQFSWRRTAEQTLAVYQRACSL